MNTVVVGASLGGIIAGGSMGGCLGPAGILAGSAVGAVALGISMRLIILAVVRSVHSGLRPRIEETRVDSIKPDTTWMEIQRY